MGLLVNGMDQVLLGRRAPHKPVLPNRWDAIGGRVEGAETDEEALIREIGEELGVIPTRMALLAFGPRPLHGGAPYWWSLFAVTEWSGGDPVNASDEHSAVDWFSPEAMSRLDLASGDYPSLARLALRLRPPRARGEGPPWPNRRP